MDKKEISVVICCLGMGRRLGVGNTKALVVVGGKSIIIRQLEMLDDYDDIRIIVGYQAKKIIDVVNEYRKDIMFGFDYEYERTGVGANLSKGLIGVRKYVVVMDGDMLVSSKDFKGFMEYDDECIGVTISGSDSPVYVKLDGNQIVCFSNNKEKFEWSGIAKIRSNKLLPGNDYVYEKLSCLFPLNAYKLETKEIDTPGNYEKMVE